MSIEKTSDRKQTLRGLQDLNIAGQAIKNPSLAKDNEDRKQPPGGNLRSSFYLNSSNSNKELQAFGSAAPRKHVHNREQASMRRRKLANESLNPGCISSSHPHSNSYASKQQPTYNIYNLGEVPLELKSSVSTSHHTTAQRILSSNMLDARNFPLQKYPVKYSTSQKNSAEQHKRLEKALPIQTLIPLGTKTTPGFFNQTTVDVKDKDLIGDIKNKFEYSNQYNHHVSQILPENSSNTPTQQAMYSTAGKDKNLIMTKSQRNRTKTSEFQNNNSYQSRPNYETSNEFDVQMKEANQSFSQAQKSQHQVLGASNRATS